MKRAFPLVFIVFALTFAFAACGGGGGGQDSSNHAPLAEVGADLPALEGDELNFVGTFSDEDSGDTHTIAWDFGDGTVTSGTLEPGHTYADDGSYTVTLTVTDDGGAAAADSLVVTVVNAPPVPDAGANAMASEGDQVAFAGSVSDPGTDDTLSYAWQFGDGNTASGSLAPSHTYEDNGTYTVTLTATDDDGGSASDSLVVTVSNLAPSVNAGGDMATFVGQSLTFTGSYTDPGKDSHSGNWNFGDGNTSPGTVNQAARQVLGSHTFASSGTYTVTLTVTDDDGASGNDSLVVDVAPRTAAPVFDPPEGSYVPWQAVTITSTTPGSSIRYTTDGSDPSPSLGTLYSGAIPVQGDTLIKAIAYVSGVADASTASADYIILEGTVKWSVDLGSPIPGSPAISPAGTIYAATSNGKLHALDADGGHSVLASFNQSTSGSPSVGADGTVFIGTMENNILAYRPDGTQRGGDNCYGGVSGFPAIRGDGRIFYGASNWGIFNNDPDFTIKYSSSMVYYGNGAFFGSPALGPDGALYIGSRSGTFFAINSSGYQSMRWSLDLGSATSSSPAIGGDGTLYIGADNGSLYAVSPDGTLRWSFPTTDAVTGSPVLGPDGTLYVGSQDGALYAIDAGGSQVWAASTGGAIRSTPAVGDDGVVYVGSGDGCLYAFDGYGDLRWSVPTGGEVNGAPTLSYDGMVYVGSGDGKLYAIYGSGEGPAPSPWPMLGRSPDHSARAGTP